MSLVDSRQAHKKSPVGDGALVVGEKSSSAGFDVGSLGALTTLCRLELDLLSFLEGSETFAGDVRVVYEQIIATAIGSDEAKTLFVIEPLYCTYSQSNTS